MATVTVTPTARALLQWEKVRAALPVQVILAPTFNEKNLRMKVHLLALQDLVRGGRVITGLDVPPQILVAEACFCASDKTLDEMRFLVTKARGEQDLYPIPTCSRCLRFCESMTGLSVDEIKEAPR